MGNNKCDHKYIEADIEIKNNISGAVLHVNKHGEVIVYDNNMYQPDIEISNSECINCKKEIYISDISSVHFETLTKEIEKDIERE